MTMVEQHMKDSLKDHVLEQVLDTEKFKAFYLRPPGGGRMMSTLLIFSPEGITICGDVVPAGPGNHGCQSTFGYGPDWFSGDLSEGYLCEKFLHKSWQADLAKEWCKDEAKALREAAEEAEGDNQSKLRGIADSLDGLAGDLYAGEMGVENFYNALADIDSDYLEDGVPGHGYNTAAAGWLCAIQQKFAELYNAMKPAPAQ